MKKTYLIGLFVGALAFTACDPSEDDYSNNITYMTADDITADITVEQQDGVNVNKVTVSTHNALPTQITNGVNTIAASSGELTLFGTGENTITIKCQNPDGSIISKEYKVNVEKMAYDVDPEYAYLTGLSSKVWTWDDSTGACWGNCGYLSGVGSRFLTGNHWWGVTAADVAGQIESYSYGLDDSGDATMTMTLYGMTLEKSSGGTGTFSFDMTQKTTTSSGAVYAEGKFMTTGDGILFPVQINSGSQGKTISTFDICYIDDDHLILSYASEGTGAYEEATFWRFKAK